MQKSFVKYAWDSKELKIGIYAAGTAILALLLEFTPLKVLISEGIASVAASIFVIVMITLLGFYLNYRFKNEDLDKSIKSMSVAMETMRKAINTINMGWLLPESDVIEIESKADEIWVFQSNLEKEYDIGDGKVGEAVLNNLKSGKKYTYFLPIHSFTNGQVETFKRIFKQKEFEYQAECKSENKESTEFSYKFVLVEDDSIFIHSEIVLYNPTIPALNKSENERNAIEFLPSDDKTSKNTKYYIDLNDQRANEIWSLGCKLIKKVGYDDEKKEAEVNTSLFMLESKLLKIESKAEEIWILKNGLGYDIEKDHPIQKLVEENLKKDEFKYKYFLLNDSEGGNLKDKAIFEKMYDKYDENFEFIMVPDDGLGLFVHSEIAIYNPTSVGKRQAIEWIPTERQCTLKDQEESLETQGELLGKQEGQEYSQIYIDLGMGSERTNEVYKICKKLKKKYREK